MCAPHWNRIKTCLLYTQNHTLLYKYRTINMARSKYATLRSGRDLHYPFHWFYETSQFSILMDFRTFIFDTLPNAWIFVQEWWKKDTEKWQFSWGDSTLKKGENIVAEARSLPKIPRQILQSKLNGTSCGYRGAPLARGLRSSGGFGSWFFRQKLHPCQLTNWGLVVEAMFGRHWFGMGEKTCEFFWWQVTVILRSAEAQITWKLHERGTECIASIGSFP